jgi:hypothetical protein
MTEKVELHCTQDDDGTWMVWFQHPRGMNVLETFDNEADARAFHKDQVDSAEI